MQYTDGVFQGGRRRCSLVVRGALLSLVVIAGAMSYRTYAFAEPQQRDKQDKEEPQRARPRVDDPELLEREINDFLKALDEFNNQMQRDLPGRAGRQGARLNLNQMQRLAALQAGRGQGRDDGRNVRLGVQVARPSTVLVDQLDLPPGQGLVIEQMSPDSPASKAGVKVNDILLELNGKPVPDNPEQFVRELADIKANEAVDAVVLRKGRKETVKGLSLPEMRAERQQPGLVPMVPRLLNPNQPALPGIRGAAPEGTSVTMTRNNDQFTVRQQQGGEMVTVTGHVGEGKAIVDEVTVVEDRKTTRYDSLDKVPEAQRATAQKLADMAGRGNVRTERGGR